LRGHGDTSAVRDRTGAAASHVSQDFSTPTTSSLPALSLGWPATAFALTRAFANSTLHRIYRGEGALLAINFSWIAWATGGSTSAILPALVSLLSMVAMYALNDLYDAPADIKNPKKDPHLIGVYMQLRRTSAASLILLKIATLALAWVALGPRAVVAVLAVMLVNLVYSAVLKGVPVVDVVWCGLWGVAYAAIVTTAPMPLALVGVMTAVCHLYQALDDRVADAANAITTTAVRSASLSRNVLAALCLALAVVLYGLLGPIWAITAAAPLVIYLSTATAHTGWLLTKVYFGIVWLTVLGQMGEVV
jgi:4-hydroxybenzoate polyprenyltransferase